ncbi:MAG TPA: OsmC family protein [Longimicrobiales bacterium]|nr:OsmC family protein [Longimicrobiales bacterium]
MPIVFGEMASSVEEIVRAFERYGDRVRGTYRAHYRFDAGTADPYAPPRLERPESLRDNPPDVVYPWEQVFLAAAACAGSDYPMLAAHLGIPLERVDFVVEGVFDPRGEFDGLAGFEAPAEARHCYATLHVRAAVASSAPRAELERLHERVLSHNMVLGALRGVPRTSEIAVLAARARADAPTGAR